MENPKTLITTIRFRNLLSDLSAQGPKTSIRFRLLGEMWKPNFMRVTKVAGRCVIFVDDATHEFVFVSDLTDIIQFEIDDRYQGIQPHFHYEVSTQV